MTIPKEVFVSHASKDKKFLKRLVAMLGKHQIPVWYSQTEIRGAQQWHDEIGAALTRCDWFLLVLSAHSVKSMWVKRELLFALQQNRFEEKIIPVLYKSCDYEKLSWVLSISQFVDFQKGFDKGCHELLRIWDIDYQGDDYP